MKKKLKGKVVDFRYGVGASFLVLCFRTGKRVAVTKGTVEDYLISLSSPYSWDEIFLQKDLALQVQLLTELYRSDIIAPSGKQK